MTSGDHAPARDGQLGLMPGPDETTRMRPQAPLDNDDATAILGRGGDELETQVLQRPPPAPPTPTGTKRKLLLVLGAVTALLAILVGIVLLMVAAGIIAFTA